MQKYYQIIDRNIRNIIGLNKKIAVYPMGMLGLYAKNILNNRYGREGIYIDNIQCGYSSNIISFNEFLSLHTSDYVVLICSAKKEIEKELIEQCSEAGLEAVSVRDPHLDSGADKTEFFKNIIDACRIKKAVGFPLIRIGKYSDGGYVMLDDFEHISCCYSFGIGTETSWEEDMSAKGFDIYCYDHTISHMPGNSEKFHFFRIGIGGSDDPNKMLQSMSSIINQNGTYSREMILKMDVEGAEWEFLLETDIGILSYFKQITFELHDLNQINRKQEILACLNKLRTMHQPVWIHGNNAGIAERSGGYTVPEMLEITYARKDSYIFEDCVYRCPGAADHPNVDSYNEICLDGWGKR